MAKYQIQNRRHARIKSYFKKKVPNIDINRFNKSQMVDYSFSMGRFNQDEQIENKTNANSTKTLSIFIEIGMFIFILTIVRVMYFVFFNHELWMNIKFFSLFEKFSQISYLTYTFSRII